MGPGVKLLIHEGLGATSSVQSGFFGDELGPSKSNLF